MSSPENDNTCGAAKNYYVAFLNIGQFYNGVGEKTCARASATRHTKGTGEKSGRNQEKNSETQKIINGILWFHQI
jgi:hypothetical protein